MSAQTGLNDLLSTDVVRAVAEWRVPTSEAERADRSSLETLWLRVYAWFFLIAGLFYYFLIGREFRSPDVLFFSQIEVMSMIALSQFALHFLYWRIANKIVLSFGLKRLKTKVPTESACPVCLEIFQSQVVTGYDEGYMWLNEGTLYYKGLQTVFRINSSDVVPVKQWRNSHRPNLDGGRLPRWIHLLGDTTPMQLHIKMIDPFEDHGTRRRTANFDRFLAKWLVDRPDGSLESKLPPSKLHPALRSIGKHRYEGLIAGLALIVINLLLVFTSRIGVIGNDLAGIGNLLPVAVGLVMLVLAVRMAWQNWHNIQVRLKLGGS